MTTRWSILTGEYPPQPGGVADYTRLVAQGLAEAGDEVCVWAPPAAGPSEDAGVEVRRLPGNFGPRSLWQLGRELNRRPPSRLLLQYTPHAFGFKAMNVPLVWWLRHRREPLDVIFHEVAFPVRRGQPFKHNFLGRTHHHMARVLLNTCERALVSCLGWIPLLKRLTNRMIEPTWMPVPSTVATMADPTEVETICRELRTTPDTRLVGHFGTFGDMITDLLTPAIRQLAASGDDIRFVLIGRNSPTYAEQLAKEHGIRFDCLRATGEATASQVANTLAACDVVLLPYPDGVSTRRTSAMAALALGCPIVTNRAEATEPLWDAAGAVHFADVSHLADAVLALGRDPNERRALGERARTCYESPLFPPPHDRATPCLLIRAVCSQK